MVVRFVISLFALYTFIAAINAQTTLPYNILGSSSSNFVGDTKYFGSSLPIYETTTGFTSTNQMGHALGIFQTGTSNPTIIDPLTGYAYGANKFSCTNFGETQCNTNLDTCYWLNGKCYDSITNGQKPNLPSPPNFYAKLHFHAKGTVRSIFVDSDSRTRIGDVEEFRERAEQYFYQKFGLDFQYFNTYEGAQLIPFKWTDEMYLQVQDAILPDNAPIIPERNRVLVDGFLVKPLYGETVVLKGEYAASIGKTSVFLEPDEILIYLEYRIVDEFNRLYHKFRYVLCEPLKTNRVGIAGWTASVIRIDYTSEFEDVCIDAYGPVTNPGIPEEAFLVIDGVETTETAICYRNPELCSCYDPNWGIGTDQGILEVVEYDGLMDFAFSNVITFPLREQATPIVRNCAVETVRFTNDTVTSIAACAETSSLTNYIQTPSILCYGDYPLITVIP